MLGSPFKKKKKEDSMIQRASLLNDPQRIHQKTHVRQKLVSGFSKYRRSCMLTDTSGDGTPGSDHGGELRRSLRRRSSAPLWKKETWACHTEANSYRQFGMKLAKDLLKIRVATNFPADFCETTATERSGRYQSGHKNK